MPHELDEIDIDILNSLMEDGRKSFSQIGREIKVSTPTVQTRYKRLVNLGFIKSVSPILDLNKLDGRSKKKIKLGNSRASDKINLKANQKIKVVCDLCNAPIEGKPTVMRFAQFERFFCCNSCKSLYKEKYGGKIRSILSPKK